MKRAELVEAQKRRALRKSIRTMIRSNHERNRNVKKNKTYKRK